MSMRRLPVLLLTSVSALLLSACGSSSSSSDTSAASTPSTEAPSTNPPSTEAPEPIEVPTLVATHSVLGAIVSDLVGESAEVRVLIPNGVDPHEWEPSAKDVEAINKAALVVANGLNLEEGLDSILDASESPVFYATDHIVVLEMGEDSHAHDDHAHEGEAKSEDGHAHDEHAHEGEAKPADDHAHDDHAHEGEAKPEDSHAHDDHAHDGGDPHFWTDPLAVAEVVEHLSEELSSLGLDVAERAETLIADLTALDAEVVELLSAIPVEDRVMITGHVSMAYFAAHYGFELLGSIVPSLSTSAEATAANLAELKEVIAVEGVSVIFAEVGAPDDVVEALANETGARVVVVSSHLVPADNTYRSFLLQLASEVRDALTA